MVAGAWPGEYQSDRTKDSAVGDELDGRMSRNGWNVAPPPSVSQNAGTGITDPHGEVTREMPDFSDCVPPPLPRPPGHTTTQPVHLMANIPPTICTFYNTFKQF